MRPYRIPHTNVWVDLDTIQSISEPAFGKYENVVLRWQHAFRADPDEVNFGRQNGVDHSKFKWDTPEYRAEEARVQKLWREHGLDQYHKEVFVPFFTAWAGRAPV